MVLKHFPQTCLGEFQGRGPVGFFPFRPAPDHRDPQPILTVQGLVTEAVAVRQPAFVDGFIGARQHAHHAPVARLHVEIGADAVVRADRGVVLQFPRARRETERLGGQRPDRAQINHVAGQFGIHAAIEKGTDLGMLAAPQAAKLHDTGDLFAETHAARAVDAARHFGGDQRADVLVLHHALHLGVTRGVLAVAQRQILQFALAALVTDRAIERMIDQQKFHRAFLRGAGALRARAHHHAVHHRCGAGRQGLGRLFHVHQAHAAIGRHG